jgi:hypothetical protein
MTGSESADPVRHILATFTIHEVNALLMGGQACILYGAAEFSKDVDFAVLADDNNLARLQSAVEALDAEVIAVPAFERRWLEAGLAIHFRCRASQAEGFRIDVMTRMRGMDAFAVLWERRNVVDLEPDLPVPVMALPDLVASKKTQRDKDWPMLRRLVEVDYFSQRGQPADWQPAFWLSELRDVELLIEAAAAFPETAERQGGRRGLLRYAIEPQPAELAAALAEEERSIRNADRAHWEPLRKILSDLRRNR